MKSRTERNLLDDFIERYDKNASVLAQQKFVRMLDIVLFVFVIVIVCLVSVRP